MTFSLSTATIDSALAIDRVHGMTHLHMLSTNPHASADVIAAWRLPFDWTIEKRLCWTMLEITMLVDWSQ